VLIDCESCQVRDVACRDCVVSVLLHGAAARDTRERAVELDGAEQAAIEVLARSGLVPPLRLVPEREGVVTEPGQPPDRRRVKRESPRRRAVS